LAEDDQLRRFIACVLSAGLAVGCSAPPTDGPAGSAQDTAHAAPVGGEQAEVLAAAQAVLDAINGADPERLEEVMMPDATITANRPGAPPRSTTVALMAKSLADPTERFTERIWTPDINVAEPLAAVWAPYDFYRDGRFSHCGVDAFQLVRVEGTWRVQSLVSNTLQPPECEKHPDGPPEATR